MSIFKFYYKLSAPLKLSTSLKIGAAIIALAWLAACSNEPPQDHTEKKSFEKVEKNFTQMIDIHQMLVKSYEIDLFSNEETTQIISVLSVLIHDEQALVVNLRPHLMHFIELGQEIQELYDKVNATESLRQAVDLAVANAEIYLNGVDNKLKNFNPRDYEKKNAI